jgi:single-strand DNA-binding protein
MQDLKMPDVNNVLIAGNLTSDPTFRKTTNGTPVANFYIASSRKFKDNTGQWRENVCFVGVVAWYKLAESCYANLHKGSAVLVDGELQSRSLRSEDGSVRNIVEIKARRIQFLDRRPARETSAAEMSAGVSDRAADLDRSSGTEWVDTSPSRSETAVVTPEDQETRPESTAPASVEKEDASAPDEEKERNASTESADTEADVKSEDNHSAYQFGYRDWRSE